MLKCFIFLLVCVSSFAETYSQKNVLTWRSQFAAPTAAHLDAQLSKLKSALQAAQTVLAKEKSAVDFGELLRLDAIESEISDRSLNVQALEKTERALLLDRAPLEHFAFNTLRVELRRYLSLARSSDPNNIARYQEAIDTLVEYDVVPRLSFEQEQQVRTALRTLSDLGQASPLLAHWIRHRTSANVALHISKSAIDKFLKPIPFTQSVPVNKTTPEGVQINGSGVGTGTGRLIFVPDPNNLHLEVSIGADVNADAIATAQVGNRTAQVGVKSTSRIDGGVPVLLQSDLKPSIGSLWLKIATSTCNQWARFEAATRIVRRLGARVAMKKANESIPRSNAETTQTLENEIRPKFDQLMQTEVRSQLTELGGLIDNEIRFPLMRTDRFPRFHASTTSSAIYAQAWFADPTQFSAFNAPPPTNGEIDIQLHESAVNNFAVLLAGASLEEDFVRNTLMAELFEQPEEDQQTGVTNATLHFADKNPVTMQVEPAGVTLTLALKGFSQDPRDFEYPGTISALYQPVNAGKTWNLVRQGPVQINMPGYEADKRAVKILPEMVDRVLVPRVQLKMLSQGFEIQKKKISIAFKARRVSTETRGWISIQMEGVNE